MAVQFSSGYTLPGGDAPLTHARIAHAENWISGAILASSTDASEIYAAEAPGNSFLFEKWRPAALPASWSTWPGAAVDLDYCVIAAHNFASAGVEFSIELNLGAGFVSVGLDGLTVSDAAPIFLVFEPATAIAARVTFSDAGGIPAVGFVRFGRALQMEQRTRFPGRTPFALAARRVMTGQQSVAGAPLARTEIRQGMQLGFTWSNLSEDFVTATLPGFLDAIERDLFVIAERPDTHPDDVALCWISGARPRPVANGAVDLHDLQIKAEAYVNG